jgi:hypothetical protein
LEDVKTLRLDNHQKTETIRNMQLQIDINNEREKVRQVEHRIQLTSSGQTKFNHSDAREQPEASLSHQPAKHKIVATNNSRVNKAPHYEYDRHNAMGELSDSLSVTSPPPSKLVQGKVLNAAMQWKSISPATPFVSSTPLATSSLDEEIVKENMLFASEQRQSLEKSLPQRMTREKMPEQPSSSSPPSSSSISPQSSNTIHRLRALAERETSSQFSKEGSQSSGGSASKADRLTQIYMKISSRKNDF